MHKKIGMVLDGKQSNLLHINIETIGINIMNHTGSHCIIKQEVSKRYGNTKVSCSTSHLEFGGYELLSQP